MSESPVAAGVAMLNAANAGGETTPVADTSPPVQQSPQPQTPIAAPAPTNNQVPYHKELEQIPEGFRPLVEPVFKKWDADVTQRLQEVHSRYEPWKQFVDAQVEPQQVMEALNLHRLIQENPQRIYEALAEHLGVNQAGVEQGPADEGEFDLGEDSPQFDLEKDPRFQQVARQQEIILQQMQQVQQAREAQQAEAWLDQRTQQITADLQQKGIGDPDWDYILTVASTLIEHKGMDQDKALDQATELYVSKVHQYMGRPTASSSAPMVLPTNGGTPSNQTPVFESGKDRREFGAAALRAAFRNG